MQHARLAAPHDPALVEAEQRLLRDRRVSPFSPTNTRSIAWHCGFIRSAQIHETSGFARLVRHPAGRFLQHLTLFGDRDLMPMLADGPDLPLRQLVVDPYPPIPIDVGRKFSRLVHFETHHNPVIIESLPRLQRLILPHPLDLNTLQVLIAAPLDRLVELELWLDDRYQDSGGSFLLAPLFARDLPALRILRVRRADRAITRVLQPVLAQLEHLELADAYGLDLASLREMGDRLSTQRVARPETPWRK